jgi:HlyD family secretion protein
MKSKGMSQDSGKSRPLSWLAALADRLMGRLKTITISSLGDSWIASTWSKLRPIFRHTTALRIMAGALLVVGIVLVLGRARSSSVAIEDQLVGIRPAHTTVDRSVASGGVEPLVIGTVVLEETGVVDQVSVKAGDNVLAGSLIASLVPEGRERELERAKVDLEMARNELDKLRRESDPGDVATAQAQLTAAQEHLAVVQTGPTEEELKAAQAKRDGAWAKHQELLENPKGPKAREMAAALEKARVARDRAQSAYDKVRWSPDIGALPESLELQSATVEFKQALAAYQDALTVSPAQVQMAFSEAMSAENELYRLRQKPTPAELAEAKVQVAEADQKLAKLMKGASSFDIQAAELRVKRAELDIGAAITNLRKTSVLSPISGKVLELRTKKGDWASEGTVVARVADLSQLRLGLRVPEVDIAKVSMGQKLKISVDALPQRIFEGSVEEIEPSGRTEGGLVSYFVAVRFTGSSLDGLYSGMTGSATLENPDLSDGSWLVPQNSVHLQGGQHLVNAVREGRLVSVVVTPGETRADWVIVDSAGLRSGDMVVGSVASYVDEDSIIE